MTPHPDGSGGDSPRTEPTDDSDGATGDATRTGVRSAVPPASGDNSTSRRTLLRRVTGGIAAIGVGAAGLAQAGRDGETVARLPDYDHDALHSAFRKREAFLQDLQRDGYVEHATPERFLDEANTVDAYARRVADHETVHLVASTRTQDGELHVSVLPHVDEAVAVLEPDGEPPRNVASTASVCDDYLSYECTEFCHTCNCAIVGVDRSYTWACECCCGGGRFCSLFAGLCTSGSLCDTGWW